MEKIDLRWLLLGIIILLGVWIGCLLFKHHKLKAEYDNLKYELEHPIIKKDTVTQIKEITVEKPIERHITHLTERVDTVITYIKETVTDSLILTDTITVPVSLPIVEKEYSDSTYKAVVKGVEFGSYPSLESISIYQPITTITETQTIVRKPKFGFNLNIGAGYGWNPITRKFEPNIGIQLGYGYRF